MPVPLFEAGDPASFAAKRRRTRFRAQELAEDPIDPSQDSSGPGYWGEETSAIPGPDGPGSVPGGHSADRLGNIPTARRRRRAPVYDEEGVGLSRPTRKALRRVSPSSRATSYPLAPVLGAAGVGLASPDSPRGEGTSTPSRARVDLEGSALLAPGWPGAAAVSGHPRRRGDPCRSSASITSRTVSGQQQQAYADHSNDPIDHNQPRGSGMGQSHGGMSSGPPGQEMSEYGRPDGEPAAAGVHESDVEHPARPPISMGGDETRDPAVVRAQGANPEVMFPAGPVDRNSFRGG